MDADKYIPQRYPFKMTDRVIDILPGLSADAIKLLNINDWYFDNQSSDPKMPKPLAIEALAQTGACAILSMNQFAGKNVFFGGIKQATFKDAFRPGDILHLSVEMQRIIGNFGIGHGVIVRNHKVICTADLIFAVEWVCKGWCHCLRKY